MLHVDCGAILSICIGSEIHGSGVRLKLSGTKFVFIQYRNTSKGSRRLVISQHGVLRVEVVREWLLEVVNGEDPSAECKVARNA